MTALSDQERETVRDAAVGALTYVSKSDPGFFAMFKESAAGAKVLAQAPEDVRDLFKSGGFPSMPGGEGSIDDRLLGQLSSAVQLLQSKAPEQVDGFRNVLLEACNAVADSSKGVSDDERSALDRVRAALGDGGTAAGGSTPAPAGSGESLPPPTGAPA